MKELYPGSKINDLFNPAQVLKVLSYSVNTGCELDESIDKLNIKNIKLNKREALDVIISYRDYKHVNN